MRNRPPESLRPMTTPSTVMSLLAVAVPSRRRLVPESSARDTVTAAAAGPAVPSTARRSSTTTTADRRPLRDAWSAPVRLVGVTVVTLRSTFMNPQGPT